MWSYLKVLSCDFKIRISMELWFLCSYTLLNVVLQHEEEERFLIKASNGKVSGISWSGNQYVKQPAAYTQA